MDKLEQYIKDHRDDFDTDIPQNQLYEQIQSRIPSYQEKKKRSNIIMLISKMAAAFALVLASGVVIGYYIGDRAEEPIMDQNFKDYIDLEKQYVKDINHKMNVLKSHDVDPNVERDLMQLDEIYRELKAELQKSQNVNNDQIIEALIMNYQVKMDILEKVLSRVKQEDSEMNLNELRDDTISI